MGRNRFLQARRADISIAGGGATGLALTFNPSFVPFPASRSDEGEG
jgi:hypothetical protein